MTEFRPLTSFLAYSTFAYPTDHPDMLYSELNSYCDLYMPQLYINGDVSNVLTLQDMLKAGIDYRIAGLVRSANSHRAGRKRLGAQPGPCKAAAVHRYLVRAVRRNLGLATAPADDGRNKGALGLDRPLGANRS